MRWLREHAPDLLSLLIAAAVPLAGVILAIQIGISGQRRYALLILGVAILGACIWILTLGQ
jgi:hypothetical protein